MVLNATARTGVAVPRGGHAPARAVLVQNGNTNSIISYFLLSFSTGLLGLPTAVAVGLINSACMSY